MWVKKTSKKTSNLRKSSKKTSKKTSKTRKSSKKTSKKGGSSDNEKVILEYMKKLDSELKKKDVGSFCVFPEEGFKNKMKGGIKEIREIVKKSGNKHKHLACIRFSLWHGEENKNSIQQKNGILIFADIIITPIDENGELLTKKGWGVNMHWKEQDLKITKPSLKLLEKIMKKTVDKKLAIVGVFGVPFNELIDVFFTPRKINLKDYFTPLPNLI